MTTIKKLYLGITILCIIPLHAMESIFENSDIFMSLLGIPLALKTLSILYTRHKGEIELRNAVLEADVNNFCAKDVDKIKKCLDKETDINCTIGLYNKTVLMFAIEHSNKDLVEYLLKKNNIAANAFDNLGWTPLHYAMELQNDYPTKQNRQICKKLLQLRADPNKVTKWVAPPLFFAIQYGYANMIQLLVQYRANVNDKETRSCSPLEYVLIEDANLEVIKELCKANALLDNIDYNNNSAFHIAAGKTRSKECIQMLMRYGCFDYNTLGQKKNENIITRALKTFSFKQQVNPLDFDKSCSQQDKKLKKTVIETLLVFKKFYPEIDPHCQFTILSHIALLNKFTGFNKELCKYLFAKNYKKPFIYPIHNQVRSIIKILELKNDKNKTALDILNISQNWEYKQTVKPLLDADELQKNLEEFIAVSNNNKLTLDNKNVIPFLL